MMHKGKETRVDDTKFTPVNGKPIKKRVCPYCQKPFWHNGQFTIHLRTHTDEKPYKCSNCPISFKKSWQLKCHAANKHQVGELCSVCKKYLPTRQALDKHLKLHVQTNYGSEQTSCNVKKLFKCQHCDKEYTDKSPLYRHVRAKHTKHATSGSSYTSPNTTAYLCDICNKTIRGDKNDFTRHVQLHIGQKHHRCSHCSKGFYSEHTLKLHEARSHAAGVQCGTCGKNFVSTKGLERHKQLHDVFGKDIIRCYTCGINFDTQLQLNMHRKEVHHSLKKARKTHYKGGTHADSINTHNESIVDCKLEIDIDESEVSCYQLNSAVTTQVMTANDESYRSVERASQDHGTVDSAVNGDRQAADPDDADGLTASPVAFPGGLPSDMIQPHPDVVLGCQDNRFDWTSLHELSSDTNDFNTDDEIDL